MAPDAASGYGLGRVTSERIVVLDDRREISFSFEEMLGYHGGGSPGGVAHAFKVMQRAFPLLEADGRVQRRAILIQTAFGGPGARDAFELVTRAVSDERFTVDQSLARPQLGRARERFTFRLRHRDRTVVLTLREGFVSDQFIELARRKSRSDDDEQRLTAMKAAMAARVMSETAALVYDVETMSEPQS